mmetsp:Transcript_19463/g.36299  ORF Transcript_19463/g.36299 Transcript_19463/m.36299 type:complete len:233 (+) Transcript_19463:1315-2013(+)
MNKGSSPFTKVVGMDLSMGRMTKRSVLFGRIEWDCSVVVVNNNSQTLTKVGRAGIETQITSRIVLYLDQSTRLSTVQVYFQGGRIDVALLYACRSGERINDGGTVPVVVLSLVTATKGVKAAKETDGLGLFTVFDSGNTSIRKEGRMNFAPEFLLRHDEFKFGQFNETSFPVGRFHNLVLDFNVKDVQMKVQMRHLLFEFCQERFGTFCSIHGIVRRRHLLLLLLLFVVRVE